jgi:hypothetical protein
MKKSRIKRRRDRQLPPSRTLNRTSVVMERNVFNILNELSREREVKGQSTGLSIFGARFHIRISLPKQFAMPKGTVAPKSDGPRKKTRRFDAILEAKCQAHYRLRTKEGPTV